MVLHTDPVAAILSTTVIMFFVVVVKFGYRQFALKQLGWDELFGSGTIGALLIAATRTVIITVMSDAGLRYQAIVSPVAIASPTFVNVNPSAVDKKSDPDHDTNYGAKLFVFLLLSGIPSDFAKLAILSLLVGVFPKRIRPISAYLFYFGIGVAALICMIIFIFTFGEVCS